MVGVTPDGGSRRKLPQWMLGVSAAGQVKKCGDANENGTLGEKNSNVVVKCGAKRRRTKSTEQDPNCGGGAVGEKRSGRGRRKGKSRDEDAGGDGNVPETFLEKKCNDGRGRRKVRQSVARNGRKAMVSSCGSDVELEDQISTDDDDDVVELTVDDLVAIAKEHIKEEERRMKLKETSNREWESDGRLAERVSSSNKLEDSVDPRNCIQRSSIPETNISKTNGSSTSKEIALSSSSTGDPAQDMLDLFLGPLLRKTVEKETQSQSLAEDVAFSYEMKREGQSNAVREEIAPVAKKKKSSLKDKVAMFLD